MKNILLTFLFCLITPIAFAQKIELNIPVVNYVSYKVLNERTNIDFATGSLFSPLEAGFEVFSNNPENTTVRFEVYASTTSGDKKAIKIKNNKNSGKCVLSNNNELPSSSSVKESLKNSTRADKNPNSIGYQIAFFDTNSSNHPKYKNNQKAVVATLEDEEYTKNYKVSITNDTSLLTSTFDRVYDEAGDYSLTIYCTVTSN